MKLPTGLRIFGNTNYRGACPSETVEQVTFFARIRRDYPQTLGRLAIHIRNEGKRNFMEAAMHKAEGMVTGAVDIVIPGDPAFVCELKRRDHTKSTISDEQVEYLYAADEAGAFACIALGADAAQEALAVYVAERQRPSRVGSIRRKWDIISGEL